MRSTSHAASVKVIDYFSFDGSQGPRAASVRSGAALTPAFPEQGFELNFE
jgi:hypothetical protein